MEYQTYGQDSTAQGISSVRYADMSQAPKIPDVVIVPFKNFYVIKGFTDVAKEKFKPSEGHKYAYYTRSFAALNTIIVVCLMSGLSWHKEKEIE